MKYMILMYVTPTSTSHQTFPAKRANHPANRETSVRSGAGGALILLFLCCHPALSPAAQIALTLRAVGGLATAEIARAFLSRRRP